jgi:hypothetical protein
MAVYSLIANNMTFTIMQTFVGGWDSEHQAGMSMLCCHTLNHTACGRHVESLTKQQLLLLAGPLPAAFVLLSVKGGHTNGWAPSAVMFASPQVV